MANEIEADTAGQWERVAAELRSCRESQKRAWGDIDDLTLGRYLAGEVTDDERQRIDQALEQLPDLRLLTDLLHDVLSDTAPVEPSPVTLPLKPTARPRQAFWSRVRPYIGLALAASLLLSLGIVLPRLAPSSSSDESPASYTMIDSRTSLKPPERPGASFRLMSPAATRLTFEEVTTEAEVLQLRGQLKESLALVERAEGLIEKKAQAVKTVRKADNENNPRTALLYARLAEVARGAGDVDRTERFLARAYQLNRTVYGESAPATVRSRRALANCYSCALCDGAAPPAAAILANATVWNGPVRFLVAPPQAAALHADACQTDLAFADGPYQKKWKEQQVLRSANALRDRIVKQSPNEARRVVVPALIDAIRNTPDAASRVYFVRALGKLGPSAAEALPVLTERLRKADGADEQMVVLESLANLGGGAAEAVPAMAIVLGSDRAEVRDAAAAALLRLGPVARERLLALARRGYPGLNESARAGASVLLRQFDAKK
jgi:hypothetical protein